MTDVRSTASLQAAGLVPADLARMVRSSELIRLRRGAYVVPGGYADHPERHRDLVEATVGLLAPDAVVSHLSAAVMHELPLLGHPPSRVQVTRASARGGKNRGGVHLHAAPLTAAEVVDLRGVALTSLARTIVDIARSETYQGAVVIGDAAMARGLTRMELDACLLAASGRPHVSAARRVIAFLDQGSESPGESLSRILLAGAGIPAPALQYQVTDGHGRVVGRCDFAWPDRRTIAEFDGRVKYGRLLRAGERPGDAVFAEKRREDALRDLGWQVVRWTWADLAHPEQLVDRLRRAFARAGCPL